VRLHQPMSALGQKQTLAYGCMRVTDINKADLT
jgi:hypothetical protein